jgi:hypothetical protein
LKVAVGLAYTIVDDRKFWGEVKNEIVGLKVFPHKASPELKCNGIEEIRKEGCGIAPMIENGPIAEEELWEWRLVLYDDLSSEDIQLAG